MVVVLGAAALMLWPLLWPSDPDTSVQLVNGRLVGETSGYVGRVDRDARTVDVSSSLVGWRPVVLVVNEHTAIQVQDRPGEIGDLVKDLPVRVSYEVVGDKRLAKSIEVITDEAGRARAAPADAVKVPAPPADRTLATPSDTSVTGPVSPAGAQAPEAPPARAVTPPPAGPTAAPPPSRPVTPPATGPTTGAPVALPPAAPSVAAPPSPAVPPPASPAPPAAKATPPAPVSYTHLTLPTIYSV